MAKTMCEYKDPDIADSELQVTLNPNVFALQTEPPPIGRSVWWLTGAACSGQHSPRPPLPHSQRCLRRSQALQCRGSCGGRRGVILTGTRSKEAADGYRVIRPGCLRRVNAARTDKNKQISKICEEIPHGTAQPPSPHATLSSDVTRRPPHAAVEHRPSQTRKRGFESRPGRETAGCQLRIWGTAELLGKTRKLIMLSGHVWTQPEVNALLSFITEQLQRSSYLVRNTTIF